MDHMENARSSIPYMKMQDKKYDVLYMNTPFSKLDVNTLGKFPVNDITSKDAAIFMWVDPASVISASKLVEKWGLQMKSIVQVADYAKYQWMDPPIVDKEEDTKPKRNRKYKVPMISRPSWWVNLDENDRSTTEQLWLLSKGDISQILSTQMPSQMVNLPGIGKKSRAKKKETYGSEWETDRPSYFIESIIGMVEKNKRVLNVFSSCVDDMKVDSWGPAIPGGFQSIDSHGLYGELCSTMKSMKKGELHKLSSLSKYKNMSDKEKEDVLSMKEMTSIKNVLSKKFNISYNIHKDDGKLSEWIVHLIYVISCNKISSFSGKNKRKNKTSKKPKGAPPRHGIAAPSSISKELAEFCGKNPDDKMARTEVVSMLNKYILKNELQNPLDRKEIILDDVLTGLLSPAEDFGPVTYFNLYRLIGKHFPKKIVGIEDEVKVDKVKEVKVDEVKVKEVKVDEVKVDEVKVDEVEHTSKKQKVI